MICAYKLYFLNSEWFYYGSTIESEKRMLRHWQELRSKSHHNVQLQKAFELDQTMKVEFYPCQDESQARTLEDKLINKSLDNPFLCNIGKSAIGGDNLTRHPNKDSIVKKRALSQSKANQSLTKEERSKIYGKFGERNGMFGKTHTEEVKAFIAENNKKQKGIPKGPMSKEHKENFMLYIDNRDISGENNPFYGKKHTPETLAKLSAKLKAMGLKSPTAKECSIEGVIYESAAEAARKLGMINSTVSFRCRSTNPLFKDWFFVSKCPTTIENKA